MSEEGIKVYSRDGSEVGITIGAERSCDLEGCLGTCIAVRWPDGELTWPCTRGMTERDDGSYQIM